MWSESLKWPALATREIQATNVQFMSGWTSHTTRAVGWALHSAVDQAAVARMLDEHLLIRCEALRVRAGKRPLAIWASLVATLPSTCDSRRKSSPR